MFAQHCHFIGIMVQSNSGHASAFSTNEIGLITFPVQHDKDLAKNLEPTSMFNGLLPKFGVNFSLSRLATVAFTDHKFILRCQDFSPAPAELLYADQGRFPGRF